MAQIFTQILFQEPSPIFIKVMIVMNLIISAILGISEATGKQNVEYSKFWNVNNQKQVKAKIPSKMGMIFVYSPSLIACLSFFWIFPTGGIRFFMLNSAMTVHFFKRVLEVLFVHKYSGGMVLGSVLLISSLYFSLAVVIVFTQHLTLGYTEPEVDMKYIGLLIFLVGICGNFYHHYLLSKLRDQREKGYKIPQGGLFSVVICPHYLFEILGFIGISFISQTSFSFSSAVGVTLYLVGRSYVTRKWYLSKFENFPKNGKGSDSICFLEKE
ncbi:uncharacterized protein LOC132059268 isoform X2 [Lycium ferocissimum]|uniref:uncharacterized protein LOC132059268 isoform X2 n=1 Tax=Lycium ferocissimum TaxID=112874 RepID=UPI0028154FC1|nr:uncharacterized protein LOC132059268 isoform X2 [Lycium ferocissimum]